MAEAVGDRSTALLDQRLDLREHARSIFRVQPCRPALGIGRHFLGRVSHDRPEVLTDEGAGVAAGSLRSVDDRRADGEQILQALARAFQLGDVGPGADQFQGLASLIPDHLEGVLNPNVVPVPVPETVGDRSAPLLHQRCHLGEYPRGVFGVQAFRPALGIGRHLLRRVPHNRFEVLADEGAGVAARSLRRVDDRGADREQILQALAGLRLDARAAGALVRTCVLGGNPPTRLISHGGSKALQEYLRGDPNTGL